MDETVDLNRVRTFVQVVDAQSFTATAKQLGVPKSSVSRAVSRLEEELGVVLLQRTTRKLALTDEGRVYLARAREALALLGEARDAIAAADQPRGTVRFTAAPDPNGLSLADMIARFSAKYPQIYIDLVITNRRVDLIEEGIDLALRAGKLEDSSLIAKRIGASTHRLVAAPGYLEARGTPKRLLDLARHDCVLFHAPRGAQRWSLTGKQGIERVDVRGPINVDDMAYVVALTLAGAGIALAPEMLIELAVRDGRLKTVLPAYRSEGNAVYLVHPAAQHLPRRVTLFRDFLFQEMQQIFSRCATVSMWGRR